MEQDEGYLVNFELKNGKENCQKNTPEFLAKSIQYTKEITESSICVRMDSVNDSSDNIDVCLKENVEFTIKKKSRRENRRKIYLQEI